MPIIRYVEELPDDIKTQMETDLLSYEAKHGIDVNYKLFALTLKNEHKEVVGILTAHTAFAEIYLREIWVDERYQNKGYGRQLLQALEQRYRESGLNNINLVSCKYQAPDFYLKCGYILEYVRQIPENQKLDLYFFVKFFNDIKKSKIDNLVNIEHLDVISTELTKTLETGLKKHEKKHEIDVNYKKFALILFDDDEKAIGVLNAFHSYSSIYIEDLYTGNAPPGVATLQTAYNNSPAADKSIVLAFQC